MSSSLSEPDRIDLLTSIDGVVFEDAWPTRVEVDIAGVPLGVLSRDDLIRNKRAVGRTRDLADIEEVER